MSLIITSRYGQTLEYGEKVSEGGGTSLNDAVQYRNVTSVMSRDGLKPVTCPTLLISVAFGGGYEEANSATLLSDKIRLK